jgi:hypothetical protein
VPPRREGYTVLDTAGATLAGGRIEWSPSIIILTLRWATRCEPVYSDMPVAAMYGNNMPVFTHDQ